MTSAFLTAWMMGFVRAGGLLSFLPLFSGKNVSIPVRIAIAAILAYAGAGAAEQHLAPPESLLGVILAFAHELVVGLLMGLAVRLVFYALEMAGQIMSTEIGLSMSSQLDPITQNSSNTVASALTYFGTLLFIVSDGHHAVLAAFVRSFQLVAPGSIGFDRTVGDLFLQSTGRIFLVALQMSAPLLAVNFVITLTFAVLGKAAPGVNAFSESFAVRIFVGLGMLALSLGLAARLLLGELRAAPELMLRLLP